jgi:hypothetical protein
MVAEAGVVRAADVHMLCICALLWRAGRRQAELQGWLVGAGGSWCQPVVAAMWWWCNSGLIHELLLQRLMRCSGLLS